MIAANELRIGNWVIYDNTICYIVAIDNDGGIDGSVKLYSVNILKGGVVCVKIIPISNIHPIPLTEEILLKCGFETADDWWFKFKINTEEDFYLLISPKERFAYFSLRDMQVSEIRDLDHLHWLQNAYFFFVGKELEVKI